MKQLFTLFLVMSFFRITAQEPIEVMIETRPSSQGIQPAFEVAVPQATEKDAIKLWDNTIINRNLFSKSPKMEKAKDEWIVKGVVIDEITSDPMDVFTQVSTFPEKIYVKIFFRGDGGYIGSPESSQQVTDAAKQFVRNYGVDLYRLAVENELKEEEKKLNSLEGDLNKMQRKVRSFNRKVSKAEREEGNFKDDLKESESVLRSRERDAGKVAKEEDAKEELEKEIKTAEKEIKKAEREQSKFERKIRKNEKAQREIENEIAKQKTRIESVKAKLNGIR